MKRLIIVCFAGMLTAAGLQAAPDEFASKTISVGVICTDLQASLDFYTKVIGMTKTGEFDVDEDFSRRSGLAGGEAFHVEVLRLGDGEDNTQWKLMQFKEEPDTAKKKLISSNAGMQYITIFVKDLKPFVERIEAGKVAFCGDTPTPLGEDREFILVQDPDGTFIELIGPRR